jgi:hypothetical protein
MAVFPRGARRFCRGPDPGGEPFAPDPAGPHGCGSNNPLSVAISAKLSPRAWWAFTTMALGPLEPVWTSSSCHAAAHGSTGSAKYCPTTCSSDLGVPASAVTSVTLAPTSTTASMAHRGLVQRFGGGIRRRRSCGSCPTRAATDERRPARSTPGPFSITTAPTCCGHLAVCACKNTASSARTGKDAMITVRPARPDHPLAGDPPRRAAQARAPRAGRLGRWPACGW